MAKIKKAYFCKECGFEAPKWLGHCPSCGAWNSFTEEVIARENASPVTALTGNRPRSKPQRVREIEQSEQRRFDLSCTEVNGTARSRYARSNGRGIPAPTWATAR